MIFKANIHVFTDGSVSPTYGTATVSSVCPSLGTEGAARLNFQATSSSTELCAIWLVLQNLKRHSIPRKVAIFTDSRSAILFTNNETRLLYWKERVAFREMEDADWDAFFCSGCIGILASLEKKWLMRQRPETSTTKLQLSFFVVF